jgi:hypothetical protein
MVPSSHRAGATSPSRPRDLSLCRTLSPSVSLSSLANSTKKCNKPSKRQCPHSVRPKHKEEGRFRFPLFALGCPLARHQHHRRRNETPPPPPSSSFFRAEGLCRRPTRCARRRRRRRRRFGGPHAEGSGGPHANGREPALVRRDAFPNGACSAAAREAGENGTRGTSQFTHGTNGPWHLRAAFEDPCEGVQEGISNAGIPLPFVDRTGIKSALARGPSVGQFCTIKNKVGLLF